MYLCIYVFMYLFIYLFMYLFIFVFIYLFIYLFICYSFIKKVYTACSNWIILLSKFILYLCALIRRFAPHISWPFFVQNVDYMRKNKNKATKSSQFWAFLQKLSPVYQNIVPLTAQFLFDPRYVQNWNSLCYLSWLLNGAYKEKFKAENISVVRICITYY